MNRRTIWGLVAAFGITLVAAWTLLALAFVNDWIQLAPHDRAAGRIVFPIAATILLVVIFMMVAIGIFVYRDARERGMPPVLWTLVAVFVPYFVGLIIYLIMRQGRAFSCPACGRGAPHEAVFCPHCGKPVQRSCSRCKARVPTDARFCPACGAELPAVTGGA
jgi:RNA polymerase subunit RPABC4/transcription elongation factor Spt4